MKKIFIFIFGIVIGIILTIAYKSFISPSNSIILFDTEGECISSTDFQVFRVLENGNALAHEIYFYENEPIVALFLAQKNHSYYDNQIIDIPYGKCAKQIGLYKYTAPDNITKRTIPIVEISNQ